MSYLQMQKNDRTGEFWREVIFGRSFRNWGVTGLLHGNMKIGGEKVWLTQIETGKSHLTGICHHKSEGPWNYGNGEF